MKIQGIETNLAGIVRVRLLAPGEGQAEVVDHARRIAARACQAPVEFLYAARTDADDQHDLLFAGPRPG